MINMKNMNWFKAIALVLAFTFLSLEYAWAYPSSLPDTLAIEPFTSSISPDRENADAFKSYIEYVLIRDSIDPSAADLTAEHFPTQNLYGTGGKRIVVELVRKLDAGKYEIRGYVNGAACIVRLAILRDGTRELYAYRPAAPSLRMFPAVSSLEIDPAIEKLCINIQNSYDYFVNDEDQFALSRFFAYLVRKAFEDGLITKENNASYERIASIRENNTVYFTVWTEYLNMDSMELIVRSLAKKYPAKAEELALVCHAAGQTLYHFRRNHKFRDSIIRRTETFYRLAHELKSSDVLYHIQWALLLGKSGKNDQARTELNKVLPNATGDQEKTVIVNIASLYLSDAQKAIQPAINRSGAVDDDTLLSLLNISAEIKRLLPQDRYRDRPRALSIIGFAFLIDAEVYAKAHERGIYSVSGKGEEFVEKVMLALGWASHCARIAADVAIARSGNEGERVHAQQMLNQCILETAQVMDYVWSRIDAEGIGYPEEAETSQMSKTFDHIEAAAEPYNIAFNRDEVEQAVKISYERSKDAYSAWRDDISQWIKLQAYISRTFEQKVAQYKWDGNSPPGTVLSGIWSEVRDSALKTFGKRFKKIADLDVFIDNTIKSFASHYEKTAPLNDLDLAILGAFNEKPSGERTFRNIADEVMTSPIRGVSAQEEDIAQRLDLLSDIFGVTPDPEPIVQAIKADAPQAAQGIPEELVPFVRSANINGLLRLLTGPRPDIRSQAAAILSGMKQARKNQAVITALEKLAKDPLCAVRVSAVKALAKLGIKSHPAVISTYEALGTRDAEKLKEQYKNHKKEALPLLMGAADDADPGVRKTIMMVLGQVRCHDALDLLAGAARDDPDPAVQDAAATSLGMIKPLSKAELARELDRNVQTSLIRRYEKASDSYNALKGWRRDNRIHRSAIEAINACLIECTNMLDRFKQMVGQTGTSAAKPSEISALYYAIDGKLTSLLDARCEPAENTVKQVLKDDLKDVRSSLAILESAKIDPYAIPRYREELYRIQDLADDIERIMEPGSHEYLSYTVSERLFSEVLTDIDVITQKRKSLDSYAGRLAVLHNLENALDELAEKCRDARLFRELAEKLNSYIISRLIEPAFSLKEYDTLSVADKASLEQLEANTEYIKKIGRIASGWADKLGDDERSKKAMNESVLDAVRAVFQWNENILNRPPDGLIEGKLSELPGRLDSLGRLRELMKAGEVKIAAIEEMSKAAPGPVMDGISVRSKSVLESLTKLHEDHCMLSLTESTYRDESARIASRASDIFKDIEKAEQDALTNWRFTAARQVILLKALANEWVRYWMKDLASEKAANAIDASLDALVKAVIFQGDAKDVETARRDGAVAVKCLANAIRDIRAGYTDKFEVGYDKAYDKYSKSDQPGKEGLVISPVAFMMFLTEAANYYLEIADPSNLQKQPVKAPSIGLKDVFPAIVELNESRNSFDEHSSKIDMHEATQNIHRLKGMIMDSQGGDDEDERAKMFGSDAFMSYLNSELSLYYFMKYGSGARHRQDLLIQFMDSTRRLLGIHVTQDQLHDTDHAYLYEPVSTFGGIIFAPAMMKFIENQDMTIGGAALSVILGRGLQMYIENLKDGHDDLLGAIKACKPIQVVVARGLPSTTITHDGVIYFDFDFILWVIGASTVNNISVAKGGGLIAAERLFHELGHISLAQNGLKPADEEMIQIERDVVFYENVYLSHPEIAKFVDEAIAMPISLIDGTTGSFSGKFTAKEYFKKVKSWAEIIHNDPKAIESIRPGIRALADGMYRQNGPDGGIVKQFPDGHRKAVLSDAAGSLLARAYFISSAEDAILDGAVARPGALAAKERRIVISKELIPESQKSLISLINRSSEKAFREGRTRDLIEIRPFSYIQNLKSSPDSDLVVLLASEESARYIGNEKRLVFGLSGNEPILINGLVAAGRAVLYRDMARLINILRALANNDHIVLPNPFELAHLIDTDRSAFAAKLSITLPPSRIANRDRRQVNEAIMLLHRSA